MRYFCADEDLTTKPSKSSMKIMAAQLGKMLSSNDILEWYAPSRVAPLVEDGHSNFWEDTDLVIERLKEFF